MDIKRNGSQPSSKGPSEYFIGSVRIAPLFDAPASLDPVALDQASVDLVYAAPDGKDLIQRMESRNGIHTLEHAEEIGLGSRTYELVNID